MRMRGMENPIHEANSVHVVHICSYDSAARCTPVPFAPLHKIQNIADSMQYITYVLLILLGVIPAYCFFVCLFLLP